MALNDFLLRDLISLTDALEAEIRRSESDCNGRQKCKTHRVTTGNDVTMLHYIVQERARGLPFSSIAAHLNMLGVRGKNGARWYSASVRSFLQRHAYI